MSEFTWRQPDGEYEVGESFLTIASVSRKRACYKLIAAIIERYRRACTMNEQRHPVLTIGHSTHSIDAFIALLRQHGVTALADVRSAPFSRFNPQFNKETLSAA